MPVSDFERAYAMFKPRKAMVIDSQVGAVRVRIMADGSEPSIWYPSLEQDTPVGDAGVLLQVNSEEYAFVPDNLPLAKTPNIYQLRQRMDQVVTEDIPNAVGPAVETKVGELLPGEVENQIGDALGPAVTAEVGLQVPGAVTNEVDAKLPAAAAAAVDASPTVSQLVTDMSTVQPMAEATAVTANVLAALRFDPDHPTYGAVRSDTNPGPSVMAANRAAIQLAADDARDTGGTLVIKGTYWVDDTINVQSHMDGSSGYLVTDNSSVEPLLQVGNPAQGGWITSLNIITPRLRQANKPATPATWNASDIGLSLVNLNACHVTTQRITNFATGMLIHASGTGFVYNDITVGWMENNKVNFRARIERSAPDTYTGPYGGWIQENVFINGRFHHNGSQGTNVSGVAHVVLDDLVGANKFIKPSIEGNTAEWHIDCGGMYNQFDNARFESEPPRVRFRASSSDNVISYGYNAQGIVLTDLGTYNHTYSRSGIKINGSGHGTFRGYGGSMTNGVFVVMAGSGGNPATDYTVSLSPRYSRFKTSGDSFPRVELDNSNGRFYIGNGTVEPTAMIGPYGSTGITVLGEFLNLGATRIGFFGKAPVVQPAANPDTSGSTLAQLETEVNQLKAALRALGLIAT